MGILRNETNKNFTIVGNYILQNPSISLKAVGMYCKLASLPDNWKFTESGLVSICKDGIDSVRSSLAELENNNLLYRFRIRDDAGKLGENVYYISSIPMTEEHKANIKSRYFPVEIVNLPQEKPSLEKPILDKPLLEKPHLYNNNILNTNKLNNKKESNKEKKYPTLEEIQEYIKEKNLNVDAKSFFDYFETGNWIDSKGNKVKNWKQKLLTWGKFHNNTSQKQKPSKQDFLQRDYKNFNFSNLYANSDS